MALTTLDPITALIVVDLQNGLVGSPFVHPIADVVARTCALATAFRRRACRSRWSMSMAARRDEPSDHATADRFPTDGPTSSRSLIGNPATSS